MYAYLKKRGKARSKNGESMTLSDVNSQDADCALPERAVIYHLTGSSVAFLARWTQQPILSNPKVVIAW